MSKPRDNWRPYVINALIDYPWYEETVREAQRQSITTQINKGRGGSGISRTTESAALRSGLDDEQLRQYEAVKNALEEMSTRPYGKERMKLIKLIYFEKNKKTIEGAAQEVYTSYRTARRWNDEMIRTTWEWLRPGGKLDHHRPKKR